MAGLFVFDEKNIVAMSSNRGMALDTFRKVVEVIEDNPMLMAQVKQIRVANGQESIELLNGARYEIVAATSKQILISFPIFNPAFFTALIIYSIAISSLSKEGAKPPSSPRLVLNFFNFNSSFKF